MFATSAFAQEVRGIETRRVTYQGPRYDCNDHYYNTYYGFEFHNLNSIKVSVDIELYQKNREQKNPDNLIDTKSIVLNPDEAYVYKRESDDSFRKGDNEDGSSCVGTRHHDDIQYFYVRYKAYKLQ